MHRHEKHLAYWGTETWEFPIGNCHVFIASLIHFSFKVGLFTRTRETVQNFRGIHEIWSQHSHLWWAPSKREPISIILFPGHHFWVDDFPLSRERWDIMESILGFGNVPASKLTKNYKWYTDTPPRFIMETLLWCPNSAFISSEIFSIMTFFGGKGGGKAKEKKSTWHPTSLDDWTHLSALQSSGSNPAVGKGIVGM